VLVATLASCSDGASPEAAATGGAGGAAGASVNTDAAAGAGGQHNAAGGVGGHVMAMMSTGGAAGAGGARADAGTDAGPPADASVDGPPDLQGPWRTACEARGPDYAYCTREPTIPGSGLCVDTKTDKSNCGACFYTCPGALSVTCQDGVCQ